MRVLDVVGLGSEGQRRVVGRVTLLSARESLILRVNVRRRSIDERLCSFGREALDVSLKSSMAMFNVVQLVVVQFDL